MGWLYNWKYLIPLPLGSQSIQRCSHWLKKNFTGTKLADWKIARSCPQNNPFSSGLQEAGFIEKEIRESHILESLVSRMVKTRIATEFLLGGSSQNHSLHGSYAPCYYINTIILLIVRFPSHWVLTWDMRRILLSNWTFKE